jgi:hypothetical protein
LGRVRPAKPAAPAVRRLRRVKRLVEWKSGHPRLIDPNPFPIENARRGPRPQ